LYGTDLSVSRKKKLSESLERRKKESDERKKSKEKKCKEESIDIKPRKPRRARKEPWLIRLQTEVPTLPQSQNDTDIPGVWCEWPDLKKDPKRFHIHIIPPEGRWKGAKTLFKTEIPQDYPQSPPKVHCETRVYHPNIDLSGAVCLSILKVQNSNNEGWKPVLGVSHLLFGLLTLFIDPNPDDPLNHQAAKKMIEEPSEFDRLVNESVHGGHVDGIQFPNLL